MTSIVLIMPVLALGMLLLSFLMTSRMRLGSLVAAFRFQSILLALLALSAAFVAGETQLIVVAFLILLIKGWFIPSFLLRRARASVTSERLESYLRPTTLSFIGGALIVLAFFTTRGLLPVGADYLVLATSFSTVLIGLLLLVTRKDMFGQGIGFFVMENGIFTFGLALTHGMPFLFELGSLFDLMAFFILITVFTHRAQGENASVATDNLRTLVD